MNKKRFLHITMMFWIMLTTACGAAQPATIQPATTAPQSATSTATPAQPAAPTVTPTATAAPGCDDVLDIDLGTYGGLPFQNAPPIDAVNKEAILEVKYGENTIAGCRVYLRSYNGQLVGPTLRAKPGDTIKLLIKNMLPAPNLPVADHTKMNIPHEFNTTNFHAHGLHVSPLGNSDNVLRTMPPIGDVNYKEEGYLVEIVIPADHPAGTFWYHPHAHGSTAIQVSSGMAGALIIEGGLDDVPEIAAAKEQTLLLQQIAYDTSGLIENFATTVNVGNWATLRRQYTINGQLYPMLTMQPGEMQRWRLIHGGVEQAIDISFFGPGPAGLTDLGAIQNLEKVPLNEIATDGLTTGRISAWTSIQNPPTTPPTAPTFTGLTLYPGYRSDVLVKVKGAGTYYLIDNLTPSTNSSRGVGVSEPERLIASVQVLPGDMLDMPLPTEDKLTHLKLKPYDDIGDNEITGTQTAVFCLCKDAATGKNIFTINGKAFDPSLVRELKLNAVEEWHLSVDPLSAAPSHPFHIHVNPFQVERVGPDGKTKEIVWKDTILVTQAKKGDPPLVLKLRTRYQDFIGKFVMHCHFLDHEDQGMMEVIEITDTSP